MTSTIPGKLTIDPDGRVTGPIQITYNDPWPCKNGSKGSGAMSGLVLHTMVGNLPGTIQWFNDPAAQASAFFGVAQDGTVHQFFPLGQGWEAWAEAQGNQSWYSVETADNGTPSNPLTPQQIQSVAQLFEVLSRFAGFPLEVTDSTAGKGLILHSDGGWAWGGHFGCPGPVRAAQRPLIVDLAKQIRSASAAVDVTTDGSMSLAQVAAAHQAHPATVLRLTVQHHGPFSSELAGYINGCNLAALMPAGIVVTVPGQ